MRAAKCIVDCWQNKLHLVNAAMPFLQVLKDGSQLVASMAVDVHGMCLVADVSGLLVSAFT